jgi:hypothetical protein
LGDFTGFSGGRAALGGLVIQIVVGALGAAATC